MQRSYLRGAHDAHEGTLPLLDEAVLLSRTTTLDASDRRRTQVPQGARPGHSAKPNQLKTIQARLCTLPGAHR